MIGNRKSCILGVYFMDYQVLSKMIKHLDVFWWLKIKPDCSVFIHLQFKEFTSVQAFYSDFWCFPVFLLTSSA